MSATVATVQGYDAIPAKDDRHREAVAYSDLAAWLDHLQAERKRDKTIYSYEREIALLLRTYPELESWQFTEEHINHVVARKPERSAYITYSVLNSYFAWLAKPKRRFNPETGEVERKSRIPFNPVEDASQPRHPYRRPKSIFTEEEVALLCALPSPDGELCTLLFTTGLRKGEARKLRRDHIDLDSGNLVVYDGKGGKDRTVGLFRNAQKAVADLDIYEGLLDERGSPRPLYLWHTNPGGGRRKDRRNPVADTTMSRWWTAVIDKAGVRYLNMHQTRHTYGYAMRDRGWDIEKRAASMGHEDIRTTRNYGRVSEEEVAREIAGSEW